MGCPQTQIYRAHDHGPLARLLAGRSIAERRIDAAGITTALLEAGLRTRHGPAARPGRVRRRLVRGVRGACRDGTTSSPRICPVMGSRTPDGELDGERVIAWLDDVIADDVCGRPVVVGRVLGGAIAMRYAVDHGDRVEPARARRHARTVGVRTGATVRGSAPALPRRSDHADPGSTDAVLRPRLRRRAPVVSVSAGRPTATTPSTASNNRRGWRPSGR